MAAAIETKLYVTNFPSSATRQQLQQFFSRFGRVQECAIMWNSYAFVHYATMEEARRALDQSNGAMFLNRKLIVQLSTSRFRPQPKEMNNSMSQQPKQLMVLDIPSPSVAYQNFINNNNTGGGSSIKHQQQQSHTLTNHYPNEINYDMITSYNPQPSLSHSSSISDGNNFFSNTYRSPSPFYLSQDVNNGYYSQYSSMPTDRMTLSPLSLQANKINHIKTNKNIKTDIGANGEIPKLYCTNLPENCKVNDLQRLFSPFGHVIDCVILWDYYAFVTFKTFSEAEHALHALHGYIWNDRRLIVEWSRASGRRQQQQQQQQTLPSPTTPKLGSFGSEVSTSSSPRTRSSTLLPHQSVSNEQFYRNNSPQILSPIKSQSPHHAFNQNLTMMSIIQQQQQQPVMHHRHHSTIPYGTYKNTNNLESLTHKTQPIFKGSTNSSSTHHLNLSSFIDRNASNSNTFFPSPPEIATPPSPVTTTSVYQPSDIVALLEPSSSDSSTINTKSTESSTVNDITNTLSPIITNAQPSCSSTAAATAALFQENLLSSLFGSLEPFSKLFPVDDQSTSTSTSRYNNILPTSPLLTTAPDHTHHPIYYGHNASWD